MLKRTLTTLILGVLASAAAASAQTTQDLMFHTREAAGTRITQMAAIIPVPPPPPDAAARPQFANVPPAGLPIAVAVEKYLLQRGFLMDGPYVMDVQQTGGGWVITVSTPAGVIDYVIHAPGPFFPVPTDDVQRALTATLIVKISNGF